MARKKYAKKRDKSPAIFFALGIVVLVGFLIIKLPVFNKPCANSVSCIKDLSGIYQTGKVSTFLGKTVPQPKYVAEEPTQKPILGASTEEKHIFVDLANQKLTAYEGKKAVLSFPVSTGKWYPTPTGDFRIWVKLRYAHMEGGNPATGTYYSLYNIPYTMFFYNDSVSKDRGFSLHGAYWHNNFGYPMSHGCINIRPVDSKKLYDWADPPTESTTTYASAANQGTLVTVFGQPPSE